MDKNIKQIKPMSCPVCDRFYFSKLTKDDIDRGDTPNTTQCSMCGWYYDLEQTNNPDLEDQANKMSLNQYKVWYKEKRREKRNWTYYIENMPKPEPHKCPVCGEYTFKDGLSSDICPICGWEDTGFEDCPDEKPSVYMMSFNETKEIGRAHV